MELINIAQGFIGGLTVAVSMWRVQKIRIDQVERDLLDMRKQSMSCNTCDAVRLGCNKRLERLEISTDRIANNLAQFMRNVA
jgi:hypothetical protein